MQSFRAGWGYNWKENIYKEHQFNLVSINYVQPLVVTDMYMDSAIGQSYFIKGNRKAIYYWYQLQL